MREEQGSGLAVDLATVGDAKDEDLDLRIDDVIDDPVLTDTDPVLAVAARQLQAAARPGVIGKILDRLFDPRPVLRVNTTEGLCRGAALEDRI